MYSPLRTHNKSKPSHSTSDTSTMKLCARQATNSSMSRSLPLALRTTSRWNSSRRFHTPATCCQQRRGVMSLVLFMNPHHMSPPHTSTTPSMHVPQLPLGPQPKQCATIPSPVPLTMVYYLTLLMLPQQSPHLPCIRLATSRP